MYIPTPDQYLATFPPLTQALAHRLRALVKRALPESTEQVKLGWRIIGFYVPGKTRPIYTGFITPHPDHVTLGFTDGLLLDDPAGLLKGADEKLKQVRYLTFHTAREIRAGALLPYIRQAAAVALLPAGMRAYLLRVARSR